MNWIKNLTDLERKIKYWIKAARPHTLTLGLACVMTGNIAAMNTVDIDGKITFFSILTTLLLQILSNFANDYGDFKHGVDNAERIGPARAVQSGKISQKEMLFAIQITALLSLSSGLMLLSYGFRHIGLSGTLFLLLTGIAAIWSAYAYTASRNPYGYKGWGDLFVFIFFGIAAVWGTYYLQSGKIHLFSLLPAVAMGFYSIAVLNLNNIRDMECDRNSGKITMAVRLGQNGSAWYHFFLVSLATLFMIIYFSAVFINPFQFLSFLPVFLILATVQRVFSFREPAELYPVLKGFSFLILLFVFSLWIALASV